MKVANQNHMRLMADSANTQYLADFHKTFVSLDGFRAFTQSTGRQGQPRTDLKSVKLAGDAGPHFILLADGINKMCSFYAYVVTII